MPELVGASAREVVHHTIRASDRVLVTGAGGWFGMTALDLLRETDAEVHAAAAHARTIAVAGTTVPVLEWDDRTVAAFGPTVIIDCAFLTRDRVSDMAFDEYVGTNRKLTDRLLATAQGSAVRLAITISSGAAVHPVDALTVGLEANPYGVLKREAEQGLLALAGGSRSVTIARAWSVSGAYVRHPRSYALGDMILQAADGRIDIRATSPVWRRYVLADELLAVALAAAAAGGVVVDSGGPLVEMGDLADVVRSVVNPDAVIARGEVSGEPNDYHTDGLSWDHAAAAAGLSGLDLREQVAITARGILPASR